MSGQASRMCEANGTWGVVDHNCGMLMLMLMLILSLCMEERVNIVVMNLLLL